MVEIAAELGVSLSTPTHSHGSENNDNATAILSPSEISLTPMPPTRGEARNWLSYRDARFGFALEYSTEVFIYDRSQSNDGQSSNFVSRDGRARLVIFNTVNVRRKTLAQHRRSLMEVPYKDAAFDYTPQRSSWFVLSGTQKDDMFYERVTVTCETRGFHGWKLVYPLSERKFYDRIVEQVHRRYRHNSRPRELPIAQRRFSQKYGSQYAGPLHCALRKACEFGPGFEPCSRGASVSGVCHLGELRCLPCGKQTRPVSL